MNKKYITFYIISLLVVLTASAYPIYMGYITFSAYLQNGFVMAEDYPKYVIPYTPLCIALITVAACMPVLYKLCKRFTLMAASILGVILFSLCEYGFEQIQIVAGYTALPLQSWQYSLCVATPEVLQAIGEPIYAESNPFLKCIFI